MCSCFHATTFDSKAIYKHILCLEWHLCMQLNTVITLQRFTYHYCSLINVVVWGIICSMALFIFYYRVCA